MKRNAISMFTINQSEGGTESQSVLAPFGFIFSLKEQLTSLLDREKVKQKSRERGRAPNSQVNSQEKKDREPSTKTCENFEGLLIQEYKYKTMNHIK